MDSLRTTLPKVKVSFDPKRDMRKRIYVKTSFDAFDVCIAIWNLETIDLYEEFKVLYLDRRNGIIGYRELCRGTCVGTVVDIKMIFSIAVQCNASGVILIHNHPSGKTDPSIKDTEVTKKIAKGAKLFDLKLQDHLVITRKSYYSFRDEGLL